MRKTTLLTLLCILLTSCNKDSGTGTSDTVTKQTGTHTISGGTSTTDATTTSGTTTGTTSGGSKNPTTGGTTTTVPASAQSFTQEFMDLLNNHRQSIGVARLTLDEAMSKIVETHSQNMASGTTPFGHTGFSARCSQSMAALGGGNLCSENVAMGQKTPQAAFNAWMNSPGHRANMENSRVTHTGFGYARSSSGTYYWTQNFVEFK